MQSKKESKRRFGMMSEIRNKDTGRCLMLDKIVIINNHEAMMIFTDRSPIGLHSDKDIRIFIEWFLCPNSVDMFVNQFNGEMVLVKRNTQFCDEITVKIGDAA